MTHRTDMTKTAAKFSKTIKAGMTAAMKRNKFKVIYKGDDKKWLVKELRNGKSIEDLGFLSHAQAKSFHELSHKVSKNGVELAATIDKNSDKLARVNTGIIGAAKLSIMDDTIKTVHTHPGVSKISGIKRLRAMFKDNPESRETPSNLMGRLIREGRLSKDSMRGFASGLKSRNKETYKKVTPSGVNGVGGDLDVLRKFRDIKHNIYNPESQIMGLHRLDNRDKLRSSYIKYYF